ncbi:hypothetical protein ACIBHX_27875 [Nonomuraea sp. NPDC050536]|uniref:hypothetical protein n=1 Tax=Nonomuraea sp. NPDC050536 TaxID=3364366 RepID=UPI0037C6C41D
MIRKGAAATFMAVSMAVMGLGPAFAATPVDKPVPQAPAGPPDYASAADLAAMARQESLTPVATRIRNLVEDGADAGYAGLEAADGKLLVWWKGTPPKAIQKAVRQAGVPVEMRAAAYSKKELKAAAAKLWQSSGVEHGGQIHGVKVLADGSGLEALVRPGGPHALAAPAVDVPVTVTESEPMKKTSVRCDDSPGWYSGVAIRNDRFGGPICGVNSSRSYNCTGGFGVHIGYDEWLLTAGHCGAPGDTFRDGAGEVIGQATHEKAAHDLLLIQTNVSGRMWDGVPDVSDFTKPVVGWGWAYIGQQLCFSGTTSGARCGLSVDATYDRICDNDIYGNWECYYDLISAVASGQASRGGDSGGPVFSLENGAAAVRATGTVTGHVINGSREWLLFQDFGTATRDWPGLDTVNG